MKNLVLGFLFAGIASTASIASAENFTCDFSRGGAGGWVRPEIFLKIDSASGKAFVADDITWQNKKGWHNARLAGDTDNRYVVTWSVKSGLSASHQRINKMDYRVSFSKKNNKANARMTPVGYANEFSTHGTCKPAKPPKALR